MAKFHSDWGITFWVFYLEGRLNAETQTSVPVHRIFFWSKGTSPVCLFILFMLHMHVRYIIRQETALLYKYAKLKSVKFVVPLTNECIRIWPIRSSKNDFSKNLAAAIFSCQAWLQNLCLHNRREWLWR